SLVARNLWHGRGRNGVGSRRRDRPRLRNSLHRFPRGQRRSLRERSIFSSRRSSDRAIFHQLHRKSSAAFSASPSLILIFPCSTDCSSSTKITPPQVAK